LPIEAIASRTFAGVIVNGRPPARPRARAEARPAIVRSEINSRSIMWTAPDPQVPRACAGPVNNGCRQRPRPCEQV